MNRPADSVRQPSPRLSAAISTGLIILTVAAYWQVFSCDFVNFDDQDYVTENAMVQNGFTLKGLLWSFSAWHANNWHPLTWLSHMLDCQLFALNPVGHHATNLLFHVLNSLLLFALLRRITAALWPSAFVAALFALHPMHVESVAWVSERKDVLSTFFGLLAIYAYYRYTLASTPSLASAVKQRSYVAALLCFACSLLAKPMLVTLPFLLLILDFWPLRRLSFSPPRSNVPLSRLLLEKFPFLALSIASCIVTFYVQNISGAVTSLDQYSLPTRLGNALVSYARYLEKLFLPIDLAVFYPFRPWAVWQLWGSGLLLAALLWLIFRKHRSCPWLSTGILWFLGTLVPVIGIVQVGGQSMADRYSYFPSIGLFIAFTWTLRHLAAGVVARLSASPNSRLPASSLLAAGALVIVGFCLALTARQARYWKNSETLFAHCLAVTGDQHVAHSNLGSWFQSKGQLDRALSHFQTALRLNPQSAKMHSNLASALLQQGKVDQAAAEFEESLRLSPNDAAMRNNLGFLLIKQGNLDQAVSECSAAVHLRPDFVPARLNLADALALQGKFNEAVAQYSEAIRLAPPTAQAHHAFAYALSQIGRTDEAISHFQAALQLDPDFSDSHFQLAMLLLSRGNKSDACHHFEECVRLQPDWVVALNNLAWLLASNPSLASQSGPAANPASTSLRLALHSAQLTSRQDASTLDTLAAAYAANGQFTNAIQSARQAIQLAQAAGQTNTVLRFQSRLNLYLANKPYLQD